MLREDANERLLVTVSEDRLKAWLQVVGSVPADFVVPPIEDFFDLIERSKIAVNDRVRELTREALAAITELAERAKAGETVGGSEKFLVAQGELPVNAEDGRFEWSPELASRFDAPEDAHQVDYFAQNEIVSVEKGTVIGRLIAPQDGTAGLDVYGQMRPPRKPKGKPYKLGQGVELSAEGSDEVVAATTGRVVEDGGRVRIYEALDIPGDVDFNTGSVDVCVDVTVRGTVRSKFSVRTTKTLSVDKVIEAADVSVEGDITVRGGIFGQELTGRVRAGGNLAAKLLNEARVEVGGNLMFNKELLNSRVRVMGHLMAERGTIIGGMAYAREGAEVRVIGSEAGVATTVIVGIDVNVLRRTQDIEREVRDMTKAVEQLRKSIKPLEANMKRLMPAQRERATELMCKADEIDVQIEERQKESQQILEEGKPKGSPAILINEIAYPGTRLTVDGFEVRLQRALHGPVKVERRKVENVTEVVAVNQRTASVIVLPSTEVKLDELPADEPEEAGDSDESKQAVADNGRA